MTRLVHVTTTDISLAWLLGPQLEAFGEAGYEVIGATLRQRANEPAASSTPMSRCP